MSDGKVVLITGGASGIGRALGEALAERGATVVLADRQLDLAESVAAEIRQNGRAASAVALDVRDAEAFKRVADDVVSRHGRIDMFFNNAGIAVGGPVERYEPRDWGDVLDVNVQGVVNGVRAVYPHMLRQKSGHIINTASMAGLIGTGNMTSYVASKHAVVGLSKSLRVEAHRHGVNVSVLCPGFIRTAILQGGEFGRMQVPGFNAQSISRMVERLKPMDPSAFAVAALKEIDRNEPFIVLPRWWRAIWMLERLAPRLTLKLWIASYERMAKESEELERKNAASNGPAAGNGQGRSHPARAERSS
jgi:NAD(P)-dependent dehydrogenase (short-subunit alcohol dehydrogenase family)